MKLTESTSYADAHRHVSSASLWALFDGNREHLNIAHECVDRHVAPGRVAVRVAHADGGDETITFEVLSTWSARFAHWLAARGIAAGDRVAIMLEPSLAFYDEPLRRDQARRDRRAAVHALRPRGRPRCASRTARHGSS